MATADDYAAWIVKNSSKRGTPDFETVAQAYAEAKAEERMAEQAMQQPAGVQEQASAQPEAGLIDRGIDALRGGVETAAALATGAIGGSVGFAGGALGEIGRQILTGEFGTPQAVRMAEQAAVKGAQAFTYQPRGQTGQNMTQAVGKFLSEAVPPVLPVVAAPGMATRAIQQSIPSAQIVAQRAAQVVPAAAAQAATTATQAIARPARAATTAVRETLGMEQPTAPKQGAFASGGSAATPEALQRATVAQSLDVPIRPTVGELTRNADQLSFEAAAIKTPEGAPLRARAEETGAALIANLDAAIDNTGAQQALFGKVEGGKAVVDALSEGWEAAKNRTRVAYKQALDSDEAQLPVDTAQPVSLVNKKTGETTETSLIDYLNQAPKNVPSSGVTDAAGQYMINLGLAQRDGNGNLVALPTTVGSMEKWRQEISGLAKWDDKVGIRQETILKNLSDQYTEPLAGPLFTKARALRRQQATKYENRAIVSNLLRTKANSDDRRVALEKTFDSAILNGSAEDITFLKRVLFTSGKNGQQAWRELQGSTIQHIRDNALTLALDSSGREMLSTAKLNSLIQGLDKNKKLDIVLGKQQAQKIRDINEVSRWVNTVPPGTLINTSGTTLTLVAALAETGMIGGPWLTGTTQIAKMIREKKNRAKIAQALNGLQTPKQP